MLAKDLNIDGISAVILQYSRHLDAERFAVTILAGSPIAPLYRRECAAAGIGLVELPARQRCVLRYTAALLRAFFVGNYDIAHIHGNSATAALELLAAWLCGVPVRIAHGHNSTCINRRAHKLLYPVFCRLYTGGLACSASAGQWMFAGRAFQVLPNGIEPERYRFDVPVRRRTRARLGLTGKFVIGHVGRCNAQKNQRYLLEVFRLVAAREPDAALLLVGAGPAQTALAQEIARHPYRARILVYGEAERTEELYAAMDAFAFPSCYEGFGLALLEAQLSGLPCVASEVVPRDAAVTERVTFLPITDEAQPAWAEALLAVRQTEQDRAGAWESGKEDAARFDIRANAGQLEKFYRTLAEQNAPGGRKRP